MENVQESHLYKWLKEKNSKFLSKLDEVMYHIIDRVQLQIGTRLIQGILVLVAIDYTVQLIKVFDIDVRSKGEALKERCQALIARW